MLFVKIQFVRSNEDVHFLYWFLRGLLKELFGGNLIVLKTLGTKKKKLATWWQIFKKPFSIFLFSNMFWKDNKKWTEEQYACFKCHFDDISHSFSNGSKGKTKNSIRSNHKNKEVFFCNRKYYIINIAW